MIAPHVKHSVAEGNELSGRRTLVDRHSMFFKGVFDFPDIFTKEIEAGPEIMFGTLNVTNKPRFGDPEDSTAVKTQSPSSLGARHILGELVVTGRET